jgi:hypothetical protein
MTLRDWFDCCWLASTELAIFEDVRALVFMDLAVTLSVTRLA